MTINDYKEISKYFTEKTGKHCEFVRDKVTLFLKVNGKVYKHPRRSSCEDLSYTREDVIDIFNEILKNSGVYK